MATEQVLTDTTDMSESSHVGILTDRLMYSSYCSRGEFYLDDWIETGQPDHEIDYLIHELDRVDNRSESRARDRIRKEKRRKVWHERNDIKRKDPYTFWKPYKPCFICARIRGKGSAPRKRRKRGAWRQRLVGDTIIMDNSKFGARTISEVYSQCIAGEDDDLDWWLWFTEYQYTCEEDFAYKWFSEDYKLTALLDQPRPSFLLGDLDLELEALIRAWLGCSEDDFWYPFMDEEAKRINEERYLEAYEKLPAGYVGERYYDFTPVFTKPRARRGGAKKDITRASCSRVVAPSPVTDWILAECSSDLDTAFEMLSDAGETMDSDWEQVSVA